MPAVVVDDPLGVACVFSDGARTVANVSPAARGQLATDLAHGLVDLVHPHGRLDSKESLTGYIKSIKTFVLWLRAEGFAGGAADLSRAMLAEYWLALSNNTSKLSAHIQESAVRRMLLAFDDDRSVLSADVRQLVAGRPFNPPLRGSDRSPLRPYSEAEWTRIETTCRAVVDTAYARHRQAREAAARGQDPLIGGWTEENVLWLLSQTGSVSAKQLTARVGLNWWVICRRAGLPQAKEALFPNPDVVIGYLLLLGVYTGIVPDGIAGLGLGDIDWAGDTTVLLNYVKGRTAEESLTLSRKAVRLLEQWLDHSALLRSHAPVGQRAGLWLRYTASASALRTAPVEPRLLSTWVQRHALLDDTGQPLKLHRHRIRTTFESMRDRRAWFGSTRATIDPNHSPRVEGDHYLSVATAAQREAIEEIIADAQNDLLRRAEPAIMLDTDETASFAARLSGLVAGAGLTAPAITSLLAGEQDVFVAACADPLSGQHGPKGKPCPARPWVCLLCPLAVFGSRHATNLLRLKAYFSRRGRQITTTQFMAELGPYAIRVDEVLQALAAQDPTLLHRAAREVADTDDELPLRPEESTP
jgi:hypothetical protein